MRAYPLVHKLRVRLRTDSAAHGALLMRRVRILCHQAVLNDIASLLTPAAPIHVNRLVVSLGRLTGPAWEVSFRERLRAQLLQQVQQWSRAESALLREGPDVTVHRAPDQHDSGKGPLIDQWHWATQCLKGPSLTRWSTTLSDAALKRIMRALNGGCPSCDHTMEAGEGQRVGGATDALTGALTDRDAALQMLPLSALVFLAQHPALPVPAVDKTVTVSEPMARRWLTPMLVRPLSPAIQRWFQSICPASTWHTWVAQQASVASEPDPAPDADRREGAAQRLAWGANKSDVPLESGHDRDPASGSTLTQPVPVASKPESPPDVDRRATTASPRLPPVPDHTLKLAAAAGGVAKVRTGARGTPRVSVQRLARTSGQPRARWTPTLTRPLDEAAPWPIPDAGIVLLWPLLPSLLEQLGIELRSREPASGYQAMLALQTLIWEDADLAPDSLLLRLLCALPPELPTRAAAPGLTSPQQAKVATWLAALPTRLPGWQRLSITDVRTLFLQRAGVLRCERSTWQLELARDASDWLLMQWPWPLESITYPWLDVPLQVHWQGPV